jgi:hypothetical protein
MRCGVANGSIDDSNPLSISTFSEYVSLVVVAGGVAGWGNCRAWFTSAALRVGDG